MRDVFTSVVEKHSEPVYMSSKRELVQHYQQTYLKGWKQQLVKDLAAQTGMKPKNLERRFDPSRLHNVPRTKREQGQYQKLAREKTPPLRRTSNGNSITVTVKGKQDNGRGVERKRVITVTIPADKAETWVNNPDFQTIWDAGDYPDDFGEDDGNGGSGSMYEMTVS